MFNDTQNISNDISDSTFTRISIGNGVAQFKNASGDMSAQIRQTQTKTRLRSEIRVSYDKTSADPLNPAVNTRKGASAYLVVDRPAVGFSKNDLVGLVTAVSEWAAAQADKLVNGES